MIAFYLIILALTLIYLYFKYIYTHWKRKGVPYIKPTFPFGNLASTAFRKTAFGVNIYELYKKSSEKIVGIYLLFQPALLVRDAEVVKNILVNDFDSFHDRGVYNNPKDTFSENIFAATGQKWKTLRAKLTPVFTKQKMKGMLPAIISIGEIMQKYVQPMADKEDVIDVKDITTRYAMDILANAIFGLDTNVIENPNHSFRLLDRKIHNNGLMSRLRETAMFLSPKLMKILHIKNVAPDVEEYMIQIVKKNIEYREKHNIIRKDFIDCLIQLRNSGKISADDEPRQSETVADELKTMSIEYCAAQVFLFYLAGFDTSASAVSFTLFELARAPDLMKRLQNEIDEALKRHDDVLTYECMQDIPLLELCVEESIRKYPNLPLLNRICTKDYQVPNSDLKIEEGTPIIISLIGMLRDPKYFPEPMKFMPERFKEENQMYDPTAHIPFGDGPRSCIGLRLGKIVSKIGIILLLQKYNFECLEDKELEFDTYSISLTIKGGIDLKITNRQDN